MIIVVTFILICIIVFIFYYFSVHSRRTYKCPQCGEEITTEHLKAERCSFCGAPLREKN